MNTDTEQMLADAGWEVECQSPLELRHPDGSFASGQAAQCVIASLRDEACHDARHDALVRIEATASMAAAGAKAGGFESHLWTEVARCARSALEP